MSLIFQNIDGTALTSSNIKTLLSDLETSGEVILNVYTTLATNEVGVYLTVSTNLGEVDYPGINSPYSDYSEILLIGSDTENTFGLKVTRVENEVEEDVRFSFERGSTYANRIILPQLSNLVANSSVAIKLKYEADPNIPARRFYVGVNIDDS